MASREEAIVSVDWLKERLGSDGLVILDVTWYSDKNANEDYLKKHIPGARKFDLMDCVTNTEMHPRNVPSPEAFQAHIRELGVNNESRVVLYDTAGRGGFFIGSRSWWNFKLHGMEKVSVLDGSLAKWEEKGYPVASGEETKPTAGNFAANRNSDMIKQFEDVKDNLPPSKFQLLDSRATDVYSGKPEDATSGHIPGAVNIPFAANLLDADNGTFKTKEQLQKVFMDMGVELDRPVVTMCNSGMSSCSLLLAAHVAGAKDGSLFHGGFNEWKRKAPDTIEQS